MIFSMLLVATSVLVLLAGIMVLAIGPFGAANLIGIGLMGGACWLAIVARMVQADYHQDKLIQAIWYGRK